MFLDCPTLLNGNAGAQANGMALNNPGTLPAVMATEHTRNLYVSSLPNDFTTPELFELFSSFGHVVSARFMPPKGGGVGNDGAAGDAAYRGFGFVCYQRGEDAHRAMLSMIGAVVRGSKIQVRPSRRHSDGAHIGPHADGNTSGEDPRRYRSLVPHAGVPLHSNNHHLAQQQYTQQQQFQPMIMLGHSSPPSYATFSSPLAAAFPAPSSFMQQSTNNNSTSSATFLAASPSSAQGTQSISLTGDEQHDGGHRAGGAGGAGGGGGPEPPSSGSDRQTPPASTVSGPISFAPSSVKVLGTSSTSQHTTALGVSAGASQLGISSQSLGLSWQSLNQQQDATNDSGSWGGVARITTPPSTPASSPSWLIATDGGHGLQSAMSASSIAPPSTAPRQQQPNMDASAGQQHQTLHGYYTTAATSLVPQPNHAGHVPQQPSHDVQQQQQQQYFFVSSPMQHQQQYRQQMASAVHTGGGPPPQTTPPNSGGQFPDPGPQTMYYALPASRGGGGAPQFVMHHGASGIGSQQGNGGGADSYTTTSHPQQLYVLMSPPPSQSLPAR